MDRSWKTKLLRRLAPVIASAALVGCSGRSDTPVVVETSRPEAPRQSFSADLATTLANPAINRRRTAAETSTYQPRLRRLPDVVAYDENGMSLLPPVDLGDLHGPSQNHRTSPSRSTSPRVASAPLKVDSVDLSDALAAVVRQSAAPRDEVASEGWASEPVATIQPPANEASVREDALPVPATENTTPRARWSDHLAAANSRISPWGEPVAPSTARLPSRLASHGRAAAPRPAAVAEIERLPMVSEERSTPRVDATASATRRPPTVLGTPQFAPRPAAPAPRQPTPAAVQAETVGPPMPTVREVPLPTPEDIAMRSVNLRAEAMILHAFSLARRSAHYSAKAELVEVLRSVTQALDMRDGTTAHSDALARAFRALDEASDFQPRGSGLESNLDMAMLIAGHQTPALKNADLARITPLAALQRYYTYAQQQFIIAGDGQPTASASLYGLGRLQSIMSGPAIGGLSDGAPQAMVFHQAAVMVDGANYKAANELGVILARYGQYETAREMLVHSVRVSPQPQSWQNLASVHARLGEQDLARKAMHEARLVASGRTSGHDADAIVEWVPPETLARSAPQSDDVLISPASSRTTAPEQPQTREVRGLMKFLPWTRAEASGNR